jgi:hypothetical protein
VNDTKKIISDATSEASGLTSSVLVLSRIAGVTPVKLAKALTENAENGVYLAKVTTELVGIRMAQASEANAS